MKICVSRLPFMVRPGFWARRFARYVVIRLYRVQITVMLSALLVLSGCYFYEKPMPCRMGPPVGVTVSYRELDEDGGEP